MADFKSSAHDAAYWDARGLAETRGWHIDDMVTADTGSIYFTAIWPHSMGDDAPLVLRVRISDHKPAGWQMRARYAFVTCHCRRRTKRDLDRLAHRLDALAQGNRRVGRPSRPRPPPP